MGKKQFVVYFEIGALVEIDTDANTMSELTPDELEQIKDEACSIVETPEYANIVDVMFDD